MPAWKQTVEAGSELEQALCSVCGLGFRVGGEAVTCSVDGAAHHLDCWAWNGAACGTPGCAGAGAIVPLPPPPPAAEVGAGARLQRAAPARPPAVEGTAACPACGRAVPAGWRFCPACGAALTGAGAPAPPPANDNAADPGAPPPPMASARTASPAPPPVVRPAAPPVGTSPAAGPQPLAAAPVLAPAAALSPERSPRIPPEPARPIPRRADIAAPSNLRRVLIPAGVAAILLGALLLFVAVQPPARQPALNSASLTATALSAGLVTPSASVLSTKLCFPGSLCIEGRFLEVWRQYGGRNEADAGLIGPPLENAHADPASGRQVQLFRYFQMELNTKAAPPADVQFSLLGTNLYRAKYEQYAPPAQPTRGGNCKWFPATQHNVCDDFYAYWHQLGLQFSSTNTNDYDSVLTPLLGYPISEMVVSSINGKEYIMQWFERARLQRAADSGQIEIAPLGEEWSQKRLTPTAIPLPSTITVTPGVMPTDTPSPVYTATPTETPIPRLSPSTLLVPISPISEYISYTLQLGDYLSTIYTKFCYPTWEALCEQLMSEGQIAGCNSMYVGQTLRIQDLCVLTPHP